MIEVNKYSISVASSVMSLHIFLFLLLFFLETDERRYVCVYFLLYMYIYNERLPNPIPL